MELVQCTASLPGAVGSAIRAMHCLTARGQWTLELLSCTASLPLGIGQYNCCNTLALCLGAVGSGMSAIHCHTAWGWWAVELLQCVGSTQRGGGACRGSAEGPVRGAGALGERRGRLCQPSSLGVAGCSRSLGGRY